MCIMNLILQARRLLQQFIVDADADADAKFESTVSEERAGWPEGR